MSVGPDGATQQALEDLFAMCGLPNMVVSVPCDALETRKATDYFLLERVGRNTFGLHARRRRLSRTFVFGKANVIRVRGKAEKMVDAFDTVLASDHKNEHEDLSIIGCGPMVPEAMRAAYILRQEFGYETRVINIHTMKPIDVEAIVCAAKETEVVITAEEHQVGALAWRVSATLTECPELYGVPVLTGAIGVKDRFGDSGAPWELIKEFEVSQNTSPRKRWS